MSKTTVYDVSTGKYEIMEVEDTPVIEEEKVEHQPTIEEQIEEINYKFSLLPIDIQAQMLKQDLINKLGGTQNE